MASASRVMNDVTDSEHRRLAGTYKEMLATYLQAEDLINIGAYRQGSNPKIDLAVSRIDRILGYVRQDIQENVGFEQSVEILRGICGE